MQVAFFAFGRFDCEYGTSAQFKCFVIACGSGEPNAHKVVIFATVILHPFWNAFQVPFVEVAPGKFTRETGVLWKFWPEFVNVLVFIYAQVEEVFG